jgi:hypothetical protein
VNFDLLLKSVAVVVFSSSAASGSDTTKVTLFFLLSFFPELDAATGSPFLLYLDFARIGRGRTDRDSDIKKI